MSRRGNFEASDLLRQMEAAQERASRLPLWLTRSGTRSEPAQRQLSSEQPDSRHDANDSPHHRDRD
jgi:hypothetical protein